MDVLDAKWRQLLCDGSWDSGSVDLSEINVSHKTKDVTTSLFGRCGTKNSVYNRLP